ncbi:MAG: HPP family protein [Gammaproteobacteria bacterium]|nr:HPP family protein [Gammaproteobacteria bacterium]MCK5263045.1 HPP family protein [Gammaproteobacteria bacterium]
MRGGDPTPARVPLHEIFWSALGCFLGIAGVYWTGHLQGLGLEESLFLVGSFGASAILIYGIPEAPPSQPRNLIGGHVLSAIVGVSCAILIPTPIIAAAAAVASAVVVMHLGRCIHPPGGATALIAVIGGSNIHNLGYWYVITPIASGALLMLLIALVTNNMSPHRRYPGRWT